MNIILTGSSGSGLLSAGEIVTEALSQEGYFVVAEREYPSLIKGGCSVFRIEVGEKKIYGISEYADIIVAFDRVGSMHALQHIHKSGLLIYGDEMYEKVPHFDETLKNKNISTIFIPEYATPKKFGANELLSNMLMIGALWRVLGLEAGGLEEAVKRRFASKPALLAIDLALIKCGYELRDAQIMNNEGNDGFFDDFYLPSLGSRAENIQPLRLLDGNECLALSAVHHGVRAYFAYPMSPSSTILTHLANWAEKTGMHVEQVEDEISVSQMTLGASFGGTRSLCATSGGGYDLMTETVSLAGMIETPLTIIVAQRPGPATGLPTWSAQEDLNLAIYSGHGEYAKAVMAVGDHEEAFRVLGEALNLAETFQIPVIVLTDKTLAETTAVIDTGSLTGVEIERGLTEMYNVQGKMYNEGLLKKSDTHEQINHGTLNIEHGTLASSSRYELTESGLSPRWLPGTGPRYYANGDEHGADGTLREDVRGVQKAHEKRLRKMKTLENATPEPILYGNPDARITLVGFGSTKMEVMDFVQINNEEVSHGWHTEGIMNNEGPVNKKNSHMPPGERGVGGISGSVNYLHYTHIWPLKTETIKELQKKGNTIIVVEHNMTGQFANLLKGTSVKIDDMWLKYDGRRFYREEMEAKIQELMTTNTHHSFFSFISSLFNS